MRNINVPENKVIIIGGDHHNGLGLARIFGLNGKKVVAVVINARKKSWISTSKFIEHCVVFETEKEGFDYILDKYSNEKLKPFVIPYSDGTALELDCRLDQFKDKFYVPSINNAQGKIASLMNKDSQYKWAVEHGIKMAKSVLVSLEKNKKKDISLFNFPLILKPVVSAKGIKSDILICQDKDELDKAMLSFEEKHYNEIFVQEFITFDYEIDAFGAICKNYPFATVVPTQTIRSYPPKKGTNSFSKIITEESVIDKIMKIVTCMQKDGFYGLYDIELFMKNDEILLNEINYRNSGDVYMALKQRYFYPLIWFNDVLGISNDGVLKHPAKPSFAMTELADFRNVLKRKVSFFKWFGDFLKTSDFAILSINDWKPFFAKMFKFFV